MKNFLCCKKSVLLCLDILAQTSRKLEFLRKELTALHYKIITRFVNIRDTVNYEQLLVANYVLLCKNAFRKNYWVL